MKTVIQLSLEHHERLLKYASEASPGYAILKNGVKVPHTKKGARSDVVVILCEEDQARSILESAKHFCPEAVPQIEKWTRLARSSVP